MASAYRTKGRNGKKHPAWRFKYRDHTGKWRYGTGWPDKKKTLEHALAVEAEARAIRKGEKEMPARWLRKRNVPIREVIKAYLEWGRSSGGRHGRPWDDQNARLKELALGWWVETLSLEVLGDIDLEAVEKALRDLMAMGKAPKTAALRVEALKSMLSWAILRRYLKEHPLRGLGKLDTQPRLPHRPLSDTEVASLLEHAKESRKVWYETALGTGFRLNELRCLRAQDLDLFGPTLFLAADFSKDRKDHSQPITRKLADKLKVLAEKRANPDDRLLGIPKGPDPAAYIADDFGKARIKTITTEGKASWHLLRKSFVNAVVRSGQDLKTIQQLARHSTAQLSMETYASADPARLRAATEAAAHHLEEAISKAACCTYVAQAAVGDDALVASPKPSSHLGEMGVVGDTGFEPVTSSL